MNHLIECPYPLRTTDLRNGGRRRLVTPRPGDVVDFVLMLGQYPAKHRYGTIETVSKDSCHICTHPGSIHISEHGVSISGGPFATVPLPSLVAAHDLGGLPHLFPIMRNQFVWNFGSNGSGAGNGVEFSIPRPVFLVTAIPGYRQSHTPTYTEDSGLTLPQWQMIADAVHAHLNPA